MNYDAEYYGRHDLNRRAMDYGHFLTDYLVKFDAKHQAFVRRGPDTEIEEVF